MVWSVSALFIGLSAYTLRHFMRSSHHLSKSSTTFNKFTQSLNNLKLLLSDVQGFDSTMTVMEACKILNISPLASKDTIIKAHRNLMLKNHPDNGGSNYVASKVNEAKELLLGSKPNRSL